YIIKIPKGSYKEFASNYESAGDIDRNGFKAKYEGDEGTASANNEKSYSYYKVNDYSVEDARLIISQSNRELIFHSIKENEDLNTVANKYDVRPSDLRIWNNISYGKYPKKGDSLSVWLTAAKYKQMYGVKEDKNKKINVTEKTNDNNKKEEVETNQNNNEVLTNNTNPKEVLVNKEHNKEKND